MITCSSEKRGQAILFFSLAANLFFIAFLLGRWGAPEPAAPSANVAMPPQGVMPGVGTIGMMAPPAFGPGDLFKPDDMMVDEARMKENFDKMYALRKDFADKLHAGAVSKDDIVKHFEDMDRVRGAIRSEARDRAVERISNMSAAERENFANFLMDRGRRPFGGNGRGGHFGAGRGVGMGPRGQAIQGGRGPAAPMDPAVQPAEPAAAPAPAVQDAPKP
ncbi:MAG: hypothetical protein PHS57_08935 [Alphaproteobacteria bacterium]|nr:hypothetical protein [Alphaproteobacteria bacterium]